LPPPEREPWGRFGEFKQTATAKLFRDAECEHNNGLGKLGNSLFCMADTQMLPWRCVFATARCDERVEFAAQKHLIHPISVHVVVGLFARRDKTNATGRNK
jgi:hypothetical protein